jgi:hypothetical protein
MSEPATIAAGDRSIAARDIRDSILVTGDNVRIEVSAGGLGGTLLDQLGLRRRVRKKARPRPLDLRDEPFGDTIDRKAEVASLARPSAPGPVSVVGEELVGKTYVLRAALSAWAEPGRDGIVCLYGRGRGLEDLLQALWEAVYETRPPTRPGRSELRADLARLEAVVVVDDVDLGHGDAQQLAAVAPRSRLVLVSRERVLWDGGELQVAGLPPDAALALLERDLGRSLTDDEREAAAALCAALNGHPQRLRQAATAIRRGGYSPAGDWPSAAGPQDVLEGATASLDERQRSVLALLGQFQGAQVSEGLLEALHGPGAGAVASSLVAAGLATAGSPSYAAAVEIEGLLSTTEVETAFRRAVEQLSSTETDQAPSGDDGWAALALMRNAARLGRAAELIRLGRALVPSLVLARRFGAWREAVELVRSAAASVNDRAAEGWALHEAGTRALCLDEVEAGRGLLRRALKIREGVDDVIGRAATRHNLRLPGRPPWYLRRIAHLPVLVLIGLLGILGFAGGGGAVAWIVTHGDDKPHMEAVAVEVEPAASGIVRSDGGEIDCPETCTVQLERGASVRLLPSPAREFQFAGWSDPCGVERACEFTVGAAVTLTARFRRGPPQNNSLVVTVAGDGRGFVVIGETNCRARCERGFSAGQTVVLVAHADAGSRFAGWSRLCGNSSRCPIEMTQDQSLSARFAAVPVSTAEISVAVDGPGTVASTPAGIRCGSDCSGTFEVGKSLVLTAEAAEGAELERWGPGCGASGTTCRLTVSKRVTIRATFRNRRDPRTQTSVLTVSRVGSGDGTLTVDPSNGDPRRCATSCTVEVPDQSSVRVVAAPARDSRFAGWSNPACSQQSSCTLEVDGATTLVATFVQQATLTVRTTGSGTGSVTGNAIVCPSGRCKTTVDQGAAVVLRAAAAKGSRFVGWNVASCGTNESCRVVVSADRTVEAQFELLDTLTVRLLGRLGAIKSAGVSLSCRRLVCTGQAVRGTIVRLAPGTLSGVIFTGWPNTVGCQPTVIPGRRSTCTVTLDGPRTVFAAFAVAVPLTVTVTNGVGGTVGIASLRKTCTATCSYQVPQNMSVAFVARPAPNNWFVWDRRGPCARERTTTCRLTIAAPTSVTISFYDIPG